MKNKIYILVISFIVMTVQPGYGQNIESDDDLSFLDRNPFKSWLPKVEEKIEKKLEEAKIESIGVKDHDMPVSKTIEEPAVPETQAPEIVINGLVWNTDRPQAIINGEIFGVGDMVENSKIVNIHKDGVDVIVSNELFTIKIEQTLTQSI